MATHISTKICQDSASYTILEDCFMRIHRSDISDYDNDCTDCNNDDQSVDKFISIICNCVYCERLGLDMDECPEYIYIGHCPYCRSCKCNRTTNTCIGCAFLAALETSNFEALEQLYIT